MGFESSPVLEDGLICCSLRGSWRIARCRGGKLASVGARRGYQTVARKRFGQGGRTSEERARRHGSVAGYGLVSGRIKGPILTYGLAPDPVSEKTEEPDTDQLAWKDMQEETPEELLR